jgi:hypothetical protein
MGVETQNGAPPHLLVLFFLRELEEYMWSRSWLLKQGGVILALPKHRDSKCALEFPFARHDMLHQYKELTSQRQAYISNPIRQPHSCILII